ncbi:MAG: acyl carrier protein [Magnetococcus sp. MYC-9]
MKKLEKIFQEVFQDVNINLVEDLVIRDLDTWDSFNQINLVLAVEEAYGVVITPGEVESIMTVGDLLDILASKGCTA